MRHSRSLTANERLELGLFLFMLLMGFLCVAAIMKVNGGFPSLSADTSDLPPAAAAVNTPSPAPQPAEEITTIDIIAPDPTPTPAPTPPAVEPAPKSKPTLAPPKPDTRRYNGQTYRYARTIRMRVTGYAPDPRCCWPYPGTTTASGKSVKTNGGKLVAADTSVIPMHSLVIVPGYAGNDAVPVLDRGGAIKGNRLDVLLPTFEIAQNWGVKYVDVKIYEPVKK